MLVDEEEGGNAIELDDRESIATRPRNAMSIYLECPTAVLAGTRQLAYLDPVHLDRGTVGLCQDSGLSFSPVPRQISSRRRPTLPWDPRSARQQP